MTCNPEALGNNDNAGNICDFISHLSYGACTERFRKTGLVKHKVPNPALVASVRNPVIEQRTSSHCSATTKRFYK